MWCSSYHGSRLTGIVRGPGDPIAHALSRKSRANTVPARNFHLSSQRRHQISPVHVTMASLYEISRTSYDDPGGPPPGSPPTCKSFLICLNCSVLLYIFVLSKVRGPMAINSDNDIIICWHVFPPYLLILSDSMAPPFCTKN